MSRKLVTANRLRDGLVVYLTATGAWSERLAEAAVAEDEASKDLLQRAEADARSALVVAPYLIDLVEDAPGIVPQRYREVIRAKGPSVGSEVPARPGGE